MPSGRVIQVAGIGTLAAIGHRANRRHRPQVVIPALDAPGRDGGIVHRAAHDEVTLDVPFERSEGSAPGTAELFLEQRMVADFVEDHEPVSGRRFRIRAVGPEFRQHARIIATRHHLRFVRCAGDRVHGIAGTRIAAGQRVVKRIVRVEGLRIRVVTRVHVVRAAEAGRRDVDHDAVGLIEVGGPDRHERKPPFICVGHRSQWPAAADPDRNRTLRNRSPVPSLVSEPSRVYRVLSASVSANGTTWPHSGTQKLDAGADQVAGLIDKRRQENRLPAIQVNRSGRYPADPA